MNYQFEIETKHQVFSIEIVFEENYLFLSHDIERSKNGDFVIKNGDFVLISGYPSIFQEIKEILMDTKENLLTNDRFHGSLKEWTLGSLVDDRFLMVLKNRIMSRLAYNSRFQVKNLEIKFDNIR